MQDTQGSDLLRRLSAYTAGTSAALAGGTASADHVIYELELTGINLQIDMDEGLAAVSYTNSPNTNFRLTDYGGTDLEYFDLYVYGRGFSQNNMIAHNNFFVVPLVVGQVVDDQLNFFSFAYGGPCPYGGNACIQRGERRFIGLRFEIGEDQHYGWFDLTLHGDDITLHRVGYETHPDTPVRLPPLISCAGTDANDDGRIDLTDLTIVLLQFGQQGGGLDGDANSDGVVDLQDLAMVLTLFGVVCG